MKPASMNLSSKLGIVAVAALLIIGLVTGFFTHSTDSPDPGPGRGDGGSASVTPTPDPSATPSQGSNPQKAPTVTKKQAVAFLQAYVNLSWQEDPTVVAERVQKAGGVAGTTAGSPWPTENDRQVCVNNTCSREFLKVQSLTMTKTEVRAGVRARDNFHGTERVDVLRCTLTIGPKDGQFQAALCTASGG